MMPPKPHSPRLNTRRLLKDSHNTKDPPNKLWRQARLKAWQSEFKAFADHSWWTADAQRQRHEAVTQALWGISWRLEFNQQFTEYFASIPINDEYYVLHEDCMAWCAVLSTGPDPCSIQEVLETFNPLRCSANIKGYAHMGEHGYRLPPFLSSHPYPLMLNLSLHRGMVTE